MKFIITNWFQNFADLKLDEAESVLEGDLPEAAEPLEELFHVALADVVTDVADVHT